MCADIGHLPTRDMRRIAFLNLDNLSTQWVASYPSAAHSLEAREFREVAATYFGVASPACAPLVGRPIPGTTTRRGATPLDAYGHVLASAPRMRGASFEIQHDSLKWQLFNDAVCYGVKGEHEPYRIFANVIPVNSLTGRRSNIVPDFRLHLPDADGVPTPTLFDVKTIHETVNTYPNAGMNEGQRCSAVQRRADKVNPDYVRTAENIDRNAGWRGSADQGPVRQVLNYHGRVRGLAFGTWGEASREVHELAAQLADIAAERTWREIGAQSVKLARAHYKSATLRTWGIAAVRHAARQKLHRLELMGMGGSPASASLGIGSRHHRRHARSSTAFDYTAGPEAGSWAREYRSFAGPSAT